MGIATAPAQPEPRSAPEGAATEAVQVAACVAAATKQSQSVAANSTKSTASENADHGFVTFDKGRKSLARIVAVNGKKVTVRRFNKKTGEWQTKNESRERQACIPLTAAEAEESFPGSVVASGNATVAIAKKTKNSGAIIAPAVLAEARKKTNDELVEIIDREWKGVCLKLVSLAPYIQVVFERIDAGQEVGGFRSKKKFCERVINRTYGAVVFMLRGGNPANKKRKKSPTLPSPPQRHALPPASETITPITVDTPALPPAPEFVEGEWSQARFPADHYDEERRGTVKQGEWENTDGRSIRKASEPAPGQETKPYHERKRIDVYRVYDQCGFVGSDEKLEKAKTLIRPVSSVEEMLKQADLIALVLMNEGEEHYSPAILDQVKQYLAMRRVVRTAEPEQDEDKRRKPLYHITLTVEGSKKRIVEETARVAFGKNLKDVQLVDHGYSRAADLGRAEERVTDALKTVGDLKGDLEDWKEGRPENFQGDQKEEEIEMAISSLEDIENALDGIDWNVEFPGMY